MHWQRYDERTEEEAVLKIGQQNVIFRSCSQTCIQSNKFQNKGGSDRIFKVQKVSHVFWGNVQKVDFVFEFKIELSVRVFDSDHL